MLRDPDVSTAPPRKKKASSGSLTPLQGAAPPAPVTPVYGPRVPEIPSHPETDPPHRTRLYHPIDQQATDVTVGTSRPELMRHAADYWGERDPNKPKGEYYGRNMTARRDAREQADQERELLDRRLEFQQALGNNVQGPKDPAQLQDLGVPETRRLTWEEYQALGPRQRAAVDFNAMLVQAVRKDRRLQGKYDATEEQRAKYDSSVEEMFGPDRGSETYAPETVGLLRQIGYDNDSADLDDFLGLGAAITSSDLDDLKHLKQLLPSEDAPAPTGGQLEPLEGTAAIRLENVRDLAASTQKMEAALAESTRLLQSMGKMSTLDRSGYVNTIGGRGGDPKPLTGYGAPAIGDSTTIDGMFQGYFEALANKDEDSKALLAGLNQDFAPDELDAFMTYAQNRSRNADVYGLDLGASPEVRYRTPEQMLKLLGLDSSKED